MICIIYIIYLKNILIVFLSESKEFFKWQGWEKISAGVRASMEAAEQNNKSDEVLLERSDWRFVIGGSMAHVSYNQKDNFRGMQEKIETRVMKKVLGEWKILYINLIKTHTY